MARTRSNRSSKKSAPLVPRIKIWLELDEEYVFGHGLNEILKAVDRVGSIKEAAKEVGKSYRYVWNRIREAETSLGKALVETQVGGTGTRRSSLTPLAQRFSKSFTELRDRVFQMVEQEFVTQFKL